MNEWKKKNQTFPVSITYIKIFTHILPKGLAMLFVMFFKTLIMETAYI